MEVIIAFTGHTNIEKCCGLPVPENGNIYDMWNIDHSDRGSITGIQKALQGRRRMLWRRRRCEDQAEALRHYRSDQKASY